jgi:hypothetical protein
MTTAASTPGTHPASVKSVTINTEPHPLSMTAKGGNRMQNIARKQLMDPPIFYFFFILAYREKK